MDIDRSRIQQAAQVLAAAGVDSAEHDATVLMECATTTQHFDDLISKRAKRIPLQHLTGHAYFRYITLEVGPGVFVPRPETELLAQVGIDVMNDSLRKLHSPQETLLADDVDKLVAKVTGEIESQATGPRSPEHYRPKPIAFDLCAGSGAIALALATEVPNVTVYAVEKSLEATEWLLKNTVRYSEELAEKNSRIAVHTLDATDETLFEQWSDSADVVISNPPYIPNDMIPRDPEVRDHDPHMALYGGDDGLAVPIQVARVAALLLKDGGTFAMEHADVQGDHESGLPHSLRQMTDSQGHSLWIDVKDHTDYNDLPRYTTAIRAPRQAEVQG